MIDLRVDARRGGRKGAAPLPARRAVGRWRPGGSGVDLKAKDRVLATVGLLVEELQRHAP
jgi:hypothetical protein